MKTSRLSWTLRLNTSMTRTVHDLHASEILSMPEDTTTWLWKNICSVELFLLEFGIPQICLENAEIIGAMYGFMHRLVN